MYKHLVHFFKEKNLSGATVFRGIYGFGKKSQMHSANVLRLSYDLPILIEVVELEEKIQIILPEINELVKEGLITLEKITIIK